MSILNFTRDFVWLGLGRFVVGCVTLLALRVSTNVLTSEQYGQLALLIAFQTFCGLLFINPVGQYINRHTHSWCEQKTFIPRLKEYKVFIFGVAVFGSVLAGSWFCYSGSCSLVGVTFSMFCVFIMVFSASWNGTWIPALNLLGFRSGAVVCSVMTVATGFVCSWLLTIILPNACMWFLGQAVGMGLGAIGGWFLMKKKMVDQVTRKTPLIGRKAIMKYCLPLAAATGFVWVQMSGYRFVLAYYWGESEVGFVFVGIGLAALIWNLIDTLIMQVFGPLYFKFITVYKDKGEQGLSDFMNTIVPVYLVIASAAIACDDILLMLFLDEQYRGSGKYFLLGIGIEFCRVVSNVFSNGAQIDKKMKVLVYPNVLGSIALVCIIMYVGSTDQSIDSAIVGLLIGGVVLLFSMMKFIGAKVKYKIDRLRWLLGGVVLFFSIWFSLRYDFDVNENDFFVILAYFTSITIFCLILMAMVSWRNPALLRLASIRLE